MYGVQRTRHSLSWSLSLVAIRCERASRASAKHASVATIGGAAATGADSGKPGSGRRHTIAFVFEWRVSAVAASGPNSASLTEPGSVSPASMTGVTTGSRLRASNTRISLGSFDTASRRLSSAL